MQGILYTDRDILVAVKPAGLISEEGTSESSFLSQLSKHEKERNHNSTLYPVHRLDRDVGGVIVYARTKFAAARLSEQIAEHTFIKEYLTVTEGVPDAPSGTLYDLLFRDASKNKTYVVGRIRHGVKEAMLEYKTLSGAADATLLLVKLGTGRTHQIRVQFASRNHPVLGDKRYGGRSSTVGIMLASFRLTFNHPFTKKCVSFSALPEWDITSSEALRERLLAPYDEIISI